MTDRTLVDYNIGKESVIHVVHKCGAVPSRAHYIDRVKQWLVAIPDLDETFARLDKNGDGFLSEQELNEFLVNELHFTLMMPAEAMLEMADSDGDGRISLREFKELGAVLQETMRLKAELGVAEPSTTAQAESLSEAVD